MASSSNQANPKPSGSAEQTQNEKSDELFPGCTSITDFSQQMLRTVVQATKTSNDLPTGDDYEFYSTFPSVRNVLDLEARRLLNLLQGVMRHQNVKGTITGTDHALELDEQFDTIIDANDQILERVGTWVDEASGVKKDTHKLVVAAASRPNPAVASWNKKKTGSGGSTPVQLLTARNIQRPQLSFRDKVDNSNKPFTPILASKPNALLPLTESLQLPPDISLEDLENSDFVYPHPYQYELDQWQPTSRQLERLEPQEAGPVDGCPPEFVDTVRQLAELCDILKAEKEIAVDLEHHSYRTFQGFVCLMQVSTRTHDYLIDTLALRSDMHRLNDVFTDPNITKVFHGADSDVEWLQRDFGLYLVGLFDTGQAARVLNLARFSLAHLLHLYCQVTADKQYQLSDWRMRPLHDKMVRYAQEDTHYLLYIHDRMRGELLDRGNEQKNLLHSVYQRSKAVCGKVYRKCQLREDSHLDLYLKSKKVFNAQQLQALRAIYAWRDHTAREEDESVQYVLPNHMLLQMAEILPRERQGVLACCNPIPPLLRQCQHEIHQLIMEARETSLSQVEPKRRIEPSALQHPQYHSSLSTCPHDLSKQQPMEAADVENTDPIPRKSTGLFSKEPVIVMKKGSILSALTAVSTRTRHRGASVAGGIRRKFADPVLKFLPSTGGGEASSVLKPAKSGLTWRLKANTPVTRQKRKSDVPLDSFVPEFVPAHKRAAADRQGGSAPSPSTPTTATSVPTPTPRSPQSAQQDGGANQETPVSLRQMMKKKKKKQKAEAMQSPDPVGQDSGSTPGEKKKVKKQKKKEKAGVSLAADPNPGDDEETNQAEKKKKKKKKKKVALEDIEGEITPFDYSAADKSTVTGKIKKDLHPDVFNPNFHGGGKKKNKGKKKFGSKQRKSLTFQPGHGGKK